MSHFAINADDVDAARTFYAAVLGWEFRPWGPPGFYQIRTAEDRLPGPIGALQQRRDLGTGPVRGFECTVAVADVDAATAAAVANGGRVLMAKTTITGVGDLAWLADPSGNAFGVMRYDDRAE